MAGESKNVGDMVGDVTAKDTEKKKNKGVLSRIWNGLSRIWNRLFRRHLDDFEKRLQHISKEEAAVLARMKKRSQKWRRMTRHLIIFSVLFESSGSYMDKSILEVHTQSQPYAALNKYREKILWHYYPHALWCSAI